MPIISIVVPIYNQELYLRKCIESLINQTLRDIEIILVDDGSTDTSGIICDEYKSKDERIKVIHKENGGLSDARNAGIRMIQGEYLAFVDSDDYVREDMYELLHKSIKKYKADIAVCDCQLVDEGDNELYIEHMNLSQKCYLGKEVICEKLKGKIAGQWLLVVAWNKLYHKSVFDDVTFPKGKYHEDEFVFHKIMLDDYRVAFVEEKLYFYRQRKGSITSSDNWLIKLDKIEAWYERANYFIEKEYYQSTIALEKVMHSLIEEVCQYKTNSLYSKKKIRKACGMCQEINLKLNTKSVISDWNLRRNNSFYRFPKVYIWGNRIRKKIQRIW